MADALPAPGHTAAPASTVTASATRGRPPGFARRLWREKKLGAFGALLLLFFITCALLADVVAPYGFNDISPLDRLKPPSAEHWFGTDNVGRDVLSRCLYGARLSVVIGLAAATLSTLISALIGIVSGYFGGKVDLVIQRFVDAWMIFPDLVVLIVVVAVLGPGMPQIIGILGVGLGIGGSRIVRSSVVSVREHLYVHAAQSIGAGAGRILWHHVLPNVLPPIIVLFTTRVGTAILAESGLAFLGLGVPPPAPTWGAMLSGSGRTYMFDGPWLALAPGLCLTAVVYATNVFGDALRDLLDPRMRSTR